MKRSNDYYLAQAIIAGLILVFPLVALTFFAPEKLFKYAFDWLLYTLMLITTWHFVTRRFIKRMLQNQRFYRALVGLSAIIITVALLYLPSHLLSMLWYDDAKDRAQLVSLFTKFNLVLTLTWVIGYISAQAVREKAKLESHIRNQSLKMLAQQIQPDFLYQCLDAIEQKMDKHTELASEAITDLAELLRYKLQAGKQDLVELHQEITAIAYMQRLANAGDISLTVPDEIKQQSVTVPPLLVYNLLYQLNYKVSQPLTVVISLNELSCDIDITGMSYQPRLIIKRIKSNYTEFFATQATLTYHNKQLRLSISL